jgi:subtilisin family serine protease
MIFLVIITLLPIQNGFVISTESENKQVIYDQQSNEKLEEFLEEFDHQFYIVQIKGPIDELSKQSIIDTGSEIAGYLGDNRFLIRAHEFDIGSMQQNRFITNIIEFGPENKFSKEQLQNYITSIEQEGTQPRLFAQTYQGNGFQNNKDEVIKAVEGLGGKIISYSNGLLEFEIQRDQIENVVRLDDIIWLEPAPKFSFFNNISSQLNGAEIVWSDIGLNGSGQVVTVCDTGLDNGSYLNIHQDFRGRVLHGYALGRPGDWSDADIGTAGGHGTHVAGSVLGNGYWSNGEIKGMAYNASLVVQSTLTQGGGMNIPSDMYNGLYYPPYNSYNSRIHTNSWGDAFSSGEYDSSANQTDHFIWDYPDMIVLFAAGNIFVNVEATPPGTAKNVITVGASENYRPDTIFPGRPNTADNIDQVASFSCYGTDDNRLKPDVLCQGTGILSTRSSLISNPDSKYWLGYDAFYAYAGGTSMSTPITAGAVALIRQYFTDIEEIKPSAALVKATLINGAEDMKGTGGSMPIPNYQEGWGRINISKSINPEPPGTFLYVDNETGLTSYKNFTYSVDVLNESVPLNISLVWSDYPASPAATTTLVNDLHLNVTHVSSGLTYKGNVFNAGWSTTDDTYARPDWDKHNTGYDNINNVECIRIEKPQLGRYKITVVGNNIPYGPQPFALAMAGGLEVDVLAPSNLQISPDPNGNALNLTWEKVFSPTIIGYQIFRSEDQNQSFVKINQTKGPGTAKFHDTGLIDGQEYFYKLRSVNILNNVSNFTGVVSGIPHDSVAPILKIIKPTTGSVLNKKVKIEYLNDSDCAKVIFKYYNDTNSNGLADDGSNWKEIGIDTTLTGEFYWDTSDPTIGPINKKSVILGAEAHDEVPNIRMFQRENLSVDNNPPSAPFLNQFLPNPINSTLIQLSGMAPEDRGTIRIYSNDIPIGNTSSITGLKSFNIYVNLFDGLNILTARAFDYLGNGPGPPSNNLRIMVDTLPPMAFAGGNYTIFEDTTFQFNGSLSFDTNPYPEFNNITSYKWTVKNINGTNIILNGKTPKYLFEDMGNYTITLEVQDMAGNVGKDQFWLLVLDATKPIAYAGEDFSWDEDTRFSLNANLSIDNDPELNLTGNFTWTFDDYDPDSVLDGKTRKLVLFGEQVYHSFEYPGDYQITLNVTDARGNWDTDTINITIRDITPPIADAGYDITVQKGRIAVFDGSRSSDNDPSFWETGNFTWEFNYVGDYIFRYGMNTEFRIEKYNDLFDIKLTVRDKWGNSASDTFLIYVDADLGFPYVNWSYPSDYNTKVPVTAVIKLQLNETLDVKKVPINSTTFQLFDSQDREIRGQLRYDPGESIILFIPNKVLRYSETYTVYLHSRVVDLAGNRLDGNRNNLIDDEIEDKFKLVFRTTNITTEPQNNEKNVPIDTKIGISYNSRIPTITFENMNITITEKTSGTKVKGKIKLQEENQKLIFEPNKDLKLKMDYLITLGLDYYLKPSDNVSWDTLDRGFYELTNNLSANKTTIYYSWTFRTESTSQDDGLLGFENLGFLMLIIISIIVLMIIILIFIFVIRRKKHEVEIQPKPSTEDEFGYDEEEYEEYSPYPDYEDDYYDYDYESYRESRKYRKQRKRHPGRAGRSTKKRRSQELTKAKAKRRPSRKKAYGYYDEEELEGDFEIEYFDEDEEDAGEEEYREIEFDEDELDLEWDDEDDYEDENGEIEELEEVEELDAGDEEDMDDFEDFEDFEREYREYKEPEDIEEE